MRSSLVTSRTQSTSTLRTNTAAAVVSMASLRDGDRYALVRLVSWSGVRQYLLVGTHFHLFPPFLLRSALMILISSSPLCLCMSACFAVYCFTGGVPGAVSCLPFTVTFHLRTITVVSVVFSFAADIHRRRSARAEGEWRGWVIP